LKAGGRLLASGAKGHQSKKVDFPQKYANYLSTLLATRVKDEQRLLNCPNDF